MSKSMNVRTVVLNIEIIQTLSGSNPLETLGSRLTCLFEQWNMDEPCSRNFEFKTLLLEHEVLNIGGLNIGFKTLSTPNFMFELDQPL